MLSPMALGPQLVDCGAELDPDFPSMSTDSANDSEEYGPIEYSDQFQYAEIEVNNLSLIHI